tara:strand:- start:53923 stop:54096 length:174 start_codon:yes stop_codon:yes gene_type:complete
MKLFLMFLVGFVAVSCATPKHKQSQQNNWAEKEAFLPGYNHKFEDTRLPAGERRSRR